MKDSGVEASPMEEPDVGDTNSDITWISAACASGIDTLPPQDNDGMYILDDRGLLSLCLIDHVSASSVEIIVPKIRTLRITFPSTNASVATIPVASKTCSLPQLL